MAAYEFDGAQYKKASKHQKEWGSALISQLKPHGDERILDLGCGDGVLSQQLAQLVPNGRVVGIDASKGMIDTAKAFEKNNVSFMQMDINTMDFSNEFDIIFSNAALHWILDHSRLLAHTYRALKQGGSIYWNFAGDGTCSIFGEVVQSVMDESQFAPFFGNFTWPWFMPSKAQYESLMAPIGFSEVQIIEENRDRCFANADEMTAWINQPCIVPFLTVVPDGEKEAFRQEVIRLMIEKAAQSDGTCFETFRRLNVTAKK